MAIEMLRIAVSLSIELEMLLAWDVFIQMQRNRQDLATATLFMEPGGDTSDIPATEIHCCDFRATASNLIQ